jgi:3-oxoacyl-[acyl-carrier-protein] synthase-3
MTALTAPTPRAGARIVAAGHYQPSRIVTNDELSQRVETSDEWIQQRVGVVTRHLAAPEETVAGMAEAAAAQAVKASGLTPSEIEMVVVATGSATTWLPNTASQVAAGLGLETPAVLDLNTACSGFCHGLALAQQAIVAGAARHALVVGAEKLSDWVDWDDRNTCVIFGDGAGAVVVSAADEPGIGPVAWGSNAPMGSTITLTPEARRITQEGRAVYRWATSAVVPVALEACEKAGVAPSEIAAFIPHQANARIIEVIAKKIGVTNAVVSYDIAESGNTSSASIPMALSKLLQQGTIPPSAPVLLLGFGGGLSYAAQVISCPPPEKGSTRV